MIQIIAMQEKLDDEFVHSRAFGRSQIGAQKGVPLSRCIGIGTGVFTMRATVGPAPIALLALGRHAVPDEPVTRTVGTA